jgi:hypothetical protein
MDTNKQFSLTHLALVGIGGALLAAILIAIPAGIVWRQFNLDASGPNSWGKGGPQPNTPIVVQGGSMTFRSRDKARQWKPVTVGKANGYCVDGADVSELELDGVELTSGGTPTNPTGWIGLTAPWTLSLYGRMPSSSPGVNVSQNGVTLSAQSKSCAGTSGTSVLLLPIGQAGFYPPSDELDDDDTASSAKPALSVRYRDMSSTSSYCIGPNGSAATGDEDVCERMSTIQATINSTTYTYNCRNGECTIGIGKPE